MFVVEMLYAGGTVEWHGTFITEDVAQDAARALVAAASAIPDAMGVIVRPFGG